MANRESKKGEKARADFVAAHPNPHVEPTSETNHPAGTDESTVENPSVIVQDLGPPTRAVSGFARAGVEDPSTDSMFNLADPQTRELLKKDSDQDRSPRQQRRRSGLRKTA